MIECAVRPVRLKGLKIRAACVAASVGLMLALGACNPTVKIEAPDKPIEINLNIKIDQQVRVKVDRELDDVLAKNPDLF